jgi:hypothetical protein
MTVVLIRLIRTSGVEMALNAGKAKTSATTNARNNAVVLFMDFTP